VNQHNTKVRIWDIWVRLFHWSLTVSVTFLLISGTTGYLFFDWHKTFGEFVLALIFFRLLWGCFGSSNARLSELIRSPIDAINHLRLTLKKQKDETRGHNAAGSWAILLILSSISIQAITGLFIADEDEFIEGALYGTFDEDLSYFLYQIHYINADILTVFVAVHVAMVLIYLLYAKTNLITPMITGKMHWTGVTPPSSAFFQRFWVGLLLLIVSFSTTAYLVSWLN